MSYIRPYAALSQTQATVRKQKPVDGKQMKIVSVLLLCLLVSCGRSGRVRMSGEESHFVREGKPERQQEWLLQEAVASSKQAASFRLKNERKREPDVEFRYYLDELGQARAYEIWAVGGKRQKWYVFETPWPFPRERFERDWVFRHFASELNLPADSATLVLPYLGPADPYRLPAWHIWSDGGEWYLFIDSGYLMHRERILQEKTGQPEER
ncbi:MAG: hypothetical protein L0196_05175 [candidate division Zixibacteria bacterium]|nr:hypothetical protein [candidate division Zixibacteria bacterium]